MVTTTHHIDPKYLGSLRNGKTENFKPTASDKIMVLPKQEIQGVLKRILWA